MKMILIVTSVAIVFFLLGYVWQAICIMLANLLPCEHLHRKAAKSPGEINVELYRRKLITYCGEVYVRGWEIEEGIVAGIQNAN